ncbi:MAG: radical SAM protein, partial [Clostridia bacterium]|nr:radical SAM protein [Clostridia bacterium]
MSALKKVGVISLGCDKNRVDTEKMLSVLSAKYILTNDVSEAEIIIVNTCAFLESARREAIDEILGVSAYKTEGKLEKLIVTGCLPQKFVDEMYDELVEVDAFLGVSDYDRLLNVLDEVYQGKRVNAVGKPKGETGTDRVLTTDGYAYLKIADGCNNRCSYCLIPYIRGSYRSVPFDDVIKEASSLGELAELVLVAQDTTKYGSDLQPKRTLTELIKALSELENVKKIRVLYCYPENVTDELIEEFATNDKLIKYVDMPLQHAD